MAFNKTNPKLTNAVSNENSEKESTSKGPIIKIDPAKEEKKEKRKEFNFTLLPSERKKLEVLRKKYKYRSASQFLSYLIGKLE